MAYHTHWQKICLSFSFLEKHFNMSKNRSKNHFSLYILVVITPDDGGAVHVPVGDLAAQQLPHAHTERPDINLEK